MKSDRVKSAHQQYITINKYLAKQKHEAGSSSNHRASAREKLARLTSDQFEIFAVDVYDELKRRQEGSGKPLYLIS